MTALMTQPVTHSLSTDSSPIIQAAQILAQGGLVGMPTETVYGLAVDANNIDALKKLYTVKGRPSSHPVIVHLADINQLADWAQNIPESAYQLAKAFWPGPLTLILEKQPWVPEQLTGGQNTIGLRIPNHPVALSLLQAFGHGLAAPSANRFGYVSPTQSSHVAADLGTEIDVLLEGGACDVGVESTIIDLTQGQPILLRPGMITVEDIQVKTGLQVLSRQDIQANTRVSGDLPSHYSPLTPLMLIEAEQLNSVIQQKLKEQQKIGLLALQQIADQSNLINLLMPNHPQDYARGLYTRLRELDNQALDLILVEQIPQTPEWASIQDRLTRASYTNIQKGDLHE